MTNTIWHLPTSGNHSPGLSRGSRRRCHVSVRGEKLVNLEATILGLLSALSRAQDGLAQLNAPRDSIPKLPPTAPAILRVLAEYARHGEEALSRDLTISD